MTDTAKATTLAVGTLSLDYLNLLFPDYAGLGALVTVASQMPWAVLETGPALEQVAAVANLIASAYATYTAPPAAALDRAGAARPGAKKPAAASPLVELSDREKACLSWTALGKSSWEIGRILCISENTAIFHIKNAMRKLGANSRTLAAVRAVQFGLIEPAVEDEPPVPRRAAGL